MKFQSTTASEKLGAAQPLSVGPQTACNNENVIKNINLINAEKDKA
jgi:hypothetical protein